ncbi:MAG: ATP-binding cassette domain-containing protein [Treponema sp.]|nr:ATP-binding cassette domain-containing protein [Treponema sp.]
MNDTNNNIQNDTPLLQVEGLSQYFNRNTFRAVDNISFHISKGEVFGLVGESGCGKTTTGRSVINLYDITGGKIFFNGKLINEGLLDYERKIKEAKLSGNKEEEEKQKKLLREARARIKERKKQGKYVTDIQMIFQDPVSSLNPRMTVREIIAEGLYIQGIKDEQEISRKVSDVLARVGLLSEYADRYPHEFSGGQRQRIGIARAIIMNPKLIIADEPVSALDVSIKAQVINLLNQLRKDMGLTVLFIAHDLSVVKYFSDRIAVMYYGKIVECASSEELFEHPMHPYTKSLLSAIPLPDPAYEKQRTRIIYDPKSAHDYSKDRPEMHAITPGHSVYCNNAECEMYRQELGL